MDNIPEDKIGNEGKVYCFERGSDWKKGYSEVIKFEIDMPFYICDQLEKIYDAYGTEEGLLQDYAEEYPDLIEFFKENNMGTEYEIYDIKSIIYEFGIGDTETKYYFYDDNDETNEITKEEFTENLEQGFNHWRKDIEVFFVGRNHAFYFTND